MKIQDGRMTETKHSPDCIMAFGRKDPTCLRCRELLSGAKARTWGGTSRAEPRRRFEIRTQEIRAHFSSQKHLSGGCGPVCTYGDY
jgi:hypothetical protein